jgi:hypothetical protein
MVFDDPTNRVLLTGTAPNGDRIDLVAYGGSACGISRNGVPDPARRWEPCDLDASTRELMRTLGLE